jgi:hypothetical protein
MPLNKYKIFVRNNCREKPRRSVVRDKKIIKKRTKLDYSSATKVDFKVNESIDSIYMVII